MGNGERLLAHRRGMHVVAKSNTWCDDCQAFGFHRFDCAVAPAEARTRADLAARTPSERRRTVGPQPCSRTSMTSTDDVRVSPWCEAVKQRMDHDGYWQPLWPRDVWNRHRIYFIRSGSSDLVKIGFSTDFEKRLKQLQTASPEPLSVARVIVGTFAVERFIHRMLRKQRVRGEWFRMSDDDISGVIWDLGELGLVPS